MVKIIIETTTTTDRTFEVTEEEFALLKRHDLSDEERERCDEIVERGLQARVNGTGTEHEIQDLFGNTLFF